MQIRGPMNPGAERIARLRIAVSDAGRRLTEAIGRDENVERAASEYAAAVTEYRVAISAEFHLKTGPPSSPGPPSKPAPSTRI